MKALIRFLGAAAVAVLLLAGSLVSLAGTSQIPSAIGGFVPDGGAVNVDPDQDSRAPSLVLGKLPAGETQPWVAFTEGGQGEPVRVLVAAFDQSGQTWEQRGAALNFQATDNAGSPSIDFGGSNRSVPWTAFAETAAAMGGKSQIFASKFAGNQWQLAGTLRSGAPTLNVDPGQNAANPALAAGATTPGNDPVPWVAWDEAVPGAGRQVFVRRAVADAGAQGGFRWQLTGADDPALSLPTLNVDTSRDGVEPDVVFSGANNALPWVVWAEEGQGRPRRIFAARAVTDASARGGFRWEVVGSQANCGSDEAACALNHNAARDADSPRIVSGMLPGESAPTPWVVFSEKPESSAYSQIYVMRLDPVSRDRFIPVAGSLNVSEFQNATHPDIVFVGNVPHVVWVEESNGFSSIYVKHLADARPGQERWDLDTQQFGINRQVFAPADYPAIGSSGTTPYVAWEEADGVVSIFAAHRYPDGPAWGSNRPPYIRTISPYNPLAVVWGLGGATNPTPLDPSRLDVLDRVGTPEEGWGRVGAGTIGDSRPAAGDAGVSPQSGLVPDQSPSLLGPAIITTSCDHVNGWESISEIQFKLSDATSAIFVGRYVAAENKLYVEDPDNPGTFLGGVEPGMPGAAIETKYVILDVASSRVIEHGPSSPALDVKWVLLFKPPTFHRDYVQSINIGYEVPSGSVGEGDHQPLSPQQIIIEFTGFFQVGRASVGQAVFLPIVAR